MLKVFRDNLKTFAPVLWIVIIAFIAIEFNPFASQAVGANTAAMVGDDPISLTELERSSRGLQDQYRQQFGDAWSPEMADQVTRMALSQLVDRRLLLAEAREQGLEVSDKELARALREQYEAGGFTDVEQYETAVARQYGSVSAFEQQLREDLLLQKLYQLFFGSVYVTDAELEQSYREQVERASIRYLTLERAGVTDVQVDDDRLQSWYDDNRDSFQVPEQRVFGYLLVDQALVRAQMEVDEQDLRAEYEANGEEFARPEQVRARHILLRTGGERTVEQAEAEIQAIKARIDGGEEFAEVAREVSEDPGSAARGGDLGLFPRERMTPEFSDAAFAAEIGELVGPVATPFGVHLIEVTDRQEAGSAPFEEVRGQIRERVASEMQEGAVDRVASEIEERLSATAAGADLQETLRALAEEFPATRYAETAPVGRTGVVPGLGRPEELMDVVFSMEEGNLADQPVTTPRGPAFVHLVEVQEARTQELAEVQDRVRRAVEDELRQERITEQLETARTRLAGGDGGETTLDSLAAELGVEVSNSGEFGMNEPIPGLGPNPEVSRAALAAEVGDVVGPVRTGQGAVLFEVSDRRGFDPAAFEEQKASLRDQVKQQRAQQLMATLIQERRQEVGVSYGPGVQEQLGLEPIDEAE
jgi:peptidyl-prolyl cis-trans isomerase D